MSMEDPPYSCSGHGRSPMCCDSKDNVSPSHPLPFLSQFLCMIILRSGRIHSNIYVYLFQGLIEACKPFEKVKQDYYSHRMHLPETQADIIMDAVT